MFSGKSRVLRRGGVLLFGLCLFGWLGFQPPKYLENLINHSERQLIDWRFLLRGLEAPPGDIVIVGLDDSSFRVQEDYRKEDFEPGEVFTWMRPNFSPPWDRRVFAYALERLMDAGARAVAFDFVFLGANPGDDDFVVVLSKYADRVVLGNQITYRETEAGAVQVSLQDPHDDLLMGAEEPLLGFVNIYPDSDRILRRTPLGLNLRWERVLAEGREELFEGDPAEIQATETALSWSLFSSSQPEFGNPGVVDRPMIRFYGPQGTFPTVPIEALFIRERWEGGHLRAGAFFEDKLVIVAPLSELRFKDLHPTPFGMMYGAEIHATLLANLLENSFLQTVTSGQERMIFLVLGFLLVMSFLFVKSLWWRALALAVIVITYLWLGVVAFGANGMIWPMAGPALFFTFTSLWGLSYDTALLQYDRQRIKRMFGSYLAPELVSRMVESGNEPVLGGEEIEITAFFSDIESFSVFSEQMAASDLVSLMNEYLSACATILQEEKGTLDKFIGDAIVAMFGAPLPLADHPIRAVVAGLKILEREEILRQKWTAERESRNWPEMVGHLHTRIGVHCGPAVVGNMGSTQRFNYTMMGDTVNLAARLESGAKAFGVYFLVSGEVVCQCAGGSEKILFRPIDRILVKGRETPVEIFEPLGLMGELSSSQKELVEVFERGLGLYRQRDWEGAKECFSRSEKLERRYGHNPSRIFLERISAMQTDPPGEDWDGVYRMKGK